MSLTDDTLLTLKDACEIFFGGRVTPATLKAEHARGNLVLCKIGRAWFTTPADIRVMREKCRVEVEAQGSGKTKLATLGQSSMAAPDIAQESAEMKLIELSKRFGIISRESTGRQKVRTRSLPTS